MLFIIFISFFDEASNFRYKILTNQKHELVVSNCRWNCMFKAGFSRLSNGWAKYKEKVPDVSDSKQNVETRCNSKLKFTRFIHQKCAEKIVKDE